MLLIYLAIGTVMADIRLRATGIVMDAQGINIAGVYVKLFQQQAVVGSTQTKEDGSYEMTLSLQQQEKYQFTLETTLINNLQTPIISQCTPIQKGNELVISQDIKLTVDDVTVNGPAVIAKINGQYFTKQQPLSGVAINYEINYQDKASGLSKYTFPGISNDQGVSKLFVIYPKGPAVLKFSAFKENFWTYHQTKDDEKFTLIVSQEYKLNYAITLEEGQFNQKVLGIIVNKNTLKPLAEVKVVVTFSSESQGYKVKQCSLLQKLNSVTDSNGKFEMNYSTKLWKKFIIQIEFLKEFYAHNEMTKSIVMDHEDRSKIADTWDLGIVKLPVQPQVNLDGYVIDAYKKPVDKLKITMTAVCLDIKTNFETTTDKDGHWEVLKLQLEPSNNYELTMKYKLQNGEEISNQFKFTTTEEPQQKITINPLYYETLIQPEISGSFNLEKDMLPLKVPFIINCLKDKQVPDIIKGLTDFQQKFDMKWQITRRFDQTLSCSITNENLDITQPFAQNVILKPTDWKANEKISVKYNTFKQIMSGTVKDNTTIAKFIVNAQINLKIYQKDANLHTQSVTKELSSNEKDGTFAFSFLLAKGEKSFIKITASHPDFQDYIKEDIAFNADKDYTVNSDLEMKRVESNVILHYKVNTLQQPATISLTASEPMMYFESLNSPKTYSSSDGSFKISFTCYQNIDYKVKFELHITSYYSQMYDSNKFKCVTPTKEKPEIEVTSESLFISGRFTAKFLDVNNQPTQGIEGKFSTKPVSQEVTAKSGSDGILSIQDVYLYKNQDYTGILQYKDASGNLLSAEIKFFTKNINDLYPFPDQNLAGQVIFTISGKLTLDRGQLINPVQVNVICDQSISVSGKTSLDGSFKVQFEKKANFKDTIQCKTSFSGDIEPVSYDVTFKNGQHTDSHDIQAKLKDVLLNINGQFINPLNMPQPDLSVDLILEAAGLTAEKQSLKTNAKGEWTVKGKTIKANQQYTIKLQYVNGAQQGIETKQQYRSSVFTLKPTDDFTYPNTYFQDFETCHTYGQIEKPQNMLPVQIPFSYKCNSIEKNNKNILGIFQSTYDYKYDLKFNGLVEMNKPLECEMSSGNEKVVKFNEKLILNGPKWEIQQNLKIQFITWKIQISGEAVDSTGIEKNVKDTQITITIHQKQKQMSYLRGLHHFLTQTTEFKTISTNQQYEFKFEILNEEVLQADLKATHVDFLDFAQINTIEISGTKNEELKYQINLQRVTFQATLSGAAQETGSIYIKDSNPKMANDQYNVKSSAASGKPFQVKFQCYQNVEYTANFVIENQYKQNIDYVTDPFKCKKDPEITPVTLKLLSNKIDLQLSGIVTDKEKIINQIEGATIIIEITKLEKVLQTAEIKTNNQGVYYYKFSLIKDTYTIKYKVSHPLFVDLSLTKDINLSLNNQLTTDFALERVSFQAILSGVAEETGFIYIKDSKPRMSNDQYNVKSSAASGKPFQVKFQCYEDVEYTANFVIENEHKQAIEYVSNPFKCKKAPELTTITLKSLNDKMDLNISGKILDKENIVTSVEGATIIIEITKEDKIIQRSELKTSNIGIYNLRLSLNRDIYKIKYSVSHPQFIDQSLTKDINLSANSEIKTDFTLERVVQTQKIKINLKDGNGKPIKGSAVTATGFSPKPHENVVVKGEDSGVATIEVQCFKGVDETFQMEVAVQDLKETTKQSVSCTGVSGERSVTLQSQYISLSGQIIDPFGKGSELDLSLTTQPASQQQSIKSIQGNWNSELLVSLNKNYNFIITYNGWDKQLVKEEQMALIASGQTSINFHTIYYQDLVESTINGKVQSKKYHISLKFHKIFLLKEGIEVTNTEIDQFDEYQIKYKFVAAYNQKYYFSLQVKETQKFKQEIVPYTIVPPIYNLSIDVAVTETDAYINEIKTHFSKFYLKGFLGSEYNCKDKIHRAVQHASVSIVKKGQDGDKVKGATHTGDDGRFSMYFFLSKKQVENNIIVWLYIEKEGFISPTPQLIMPSQFERFQIDEETITSIDVGYTSISPIHDMGCPSNLPTLTSDEKEMITAKKLN